MRSMETAPILSELETALGRTTPDKRRDRDQEFVRAELANLRYQMLAAHLASFIGLALPILFRT